MRPLQAPCSLPVETTLNYLVHLGETRSRADARDVDLTRIFYDAGNIRKLWLEKTVKPL